MNVILIAVISLGVIALVSAAILYVASKKFAVYEDPRIAQVAEVLPQANCGGCGYPGCSGFADACVKAGSLDGKLCPVGGQPVMTKIAEILGLDAAAAEPMVAVVRCNGTCANRPRVNQYDGAKSCAIAASLYGGETGCSYGCLGCGDCVAACQFDAIHMNPETGLPEVDEEKCTACGACAKACPKSIIEIRPQGKKSRRIYVQCVNKDKGAVARKACTVACIGCGKCVKVCPFEAITLENNLAYIDPNKCKSCRKCEQFFHFPRSQRHRRVTDHIFILLQCMPYISRPVFQTGFNIDDIQTVQEFPVICTIRVQFISVTELPGNKNIL